jgi:dissimilatory sulfite reductase (desulfoviridin) alpha/beta subunit
LHAISTLAERFGEGFVHLTTRQGVEIPHVSYENLVPLRAAIEEAGLRLASCKSPHQVERRTDPALEPGWPKGNNFFQ